MAKGSFFGAGRRKRRTETALQSVESVWRRLVPKIFLALFFVAIVAGAFIWIRSATFHWSEEEERTYRATAENRMALEEEQLRSVTNRLDARAEEFREKSFSEMRDIFLHEPGENE